MSEAAVARVRTPRLNPFAFPSDTTLRFILLVIFVVCGSGRLYGDLLTDTRTDQATGECISRNWSKLSDVNAPMASEQDARNFAAIAGEAIPSLASCAKMLRPRVWWKISGMTLVVSVAVILYWFYPIWKLRTGRLEQLSASELPEIADELRDICHVASLTYPPIFVWNPIAGGLPLAFGRSGRYHVALSGSFITRYFYSDRGAFRAIILHELAHIHNGDVGKTYLVLAFWLAFLSTTVLPSFVASLWLLSASQLSDAIYLIVYSMIWSGVVILFGLAVLRVREYYADLRASVWDRVSAIDRALAALPAIAGDGWRRYFRLHPDSRERREIVEDPSRLFRLSYFDAFGIGVAAWSIVDIIPSIMLPFFPESEWEAFIYIWLIRVILPAFVLVFAVGGIGIGVWRGAFASLFSGDRSYKRTGSLGAAFVAGSLPVFIALLISAVLQLQPVLAPVFMTTLALNIFIAVTLLLTCFLIFRWIADANSAWLEVVLQSPSPGPILGLTVAIAFLLVILALASAFFIAYFSFAATPWRGATEWIYIYDQIMGGPVLLASVAVWAFPLAALWRRKKGMATGLAGWVFLDRSARALPQQEPLRPGGPLLTGTVMGLFFWLLWEALYLRNSFPAGIADTLNSVFSWLFNWTARMFGNGGFLLPNSGMAFQALAAAIAAARARRLHAVCGLFAASVAGSIIVLGDWLYFGFQQRPSELLLVSLSMMGQGAVAALATVIVAAPIRGAVRRIFPSTAGSRNLKGGATVVAASLHVTSAPLRMANSRRGGQRLPYTPFLFSKILAALLCVVVGIGMAARVREEVRTMQEVSAYHTTAERGDSDAQNKLGEMYFRGKSVAQDDAQAVFWWHKAAEQGLADAQYNLGQMYSMGRGVKQDDAMALQWVRKAAEQGHSNAENILGYMYAAGRGLPRDDAVALQWFRRAADHGNFSAENNLGIFYALGRGTPRDDVAAVGWLRDSADHGYADAQNNLALMYQQGRALPKDDALALQWFRRAAEQGHAEALFHIAEIYEKGEVVAKDEEQAIVWLRKAAEKGYSEARGRLQAICTGGLQSACSN